MIRIFNFIPSYRGMISAETFETTHFIAAECMRRGVGFFTSTYSWFDIAELRNCVLSYWYDAMPDSTHLLLIDDDNAFSAQMVFDMIAFDKPLVAGLYAKKTWPRQWAASALPKMEVNGAFMEVEGLGAGAMLIRRDCIDTMIEKYPELIFPHVLIAQMKEMGAHRTLAFFDPIRIYEEGKVAEDIMFCRRYREAGGRVWACVGHPISHIGKHDFRACFAQEHNSAKIEPLEDGQSAA